MEDQLEVLNQQTHQLATSMLDRLQHVKQMDKKVAAVGIALASVQEKQIAILNRDGGINQAIADMHEKQTKVNEQYQYLYNVGMEYLKKVNHRNQVIEKAEMDLQTTSSKSAENKKQINKLVSRRSRRVSSRMEEFKQRLEQFDEVANHIQSDKEIKAVYDVLLTVVTEIKYLIESEARDYNVNSKRILQLNENVKTLATAIHYYQQYVSGLSQKANELGDVLDVMSYYLIQMPSKQDSNPTDILNMFINYKPKHQPKTNVTSDNTNHSHSEDVNPEQVVEIKRRPKPDMDFQPDEPSINDESEDTSSDSLAEDVTEKASDDQTNTQSESSYVPATIEPKTKKKHPFWMFWKK